MFAEELTYQSPSSGELALSAPPGDCLEVSQNKIYLAVYSQDMSGCDKAF